MMAGKESARLKTGGFVYTIFDDLMQGRLKIPKFITGAVDPNSGKPRILIIVNAEDVHLKKPVPKRSHRGTRYTAGENWSS